MLRKNKFSDNLGGASAAGYCPSVVQRIEAHCFRRGASTEESEDNCAVMAAKEIRDFLENGNIKNSVNYPGCDMGICSLEGRITICHRNIPNMLSQFTKVMGDAGVNIGDMVNKSKENYAYTVMDLESPSTPEMVKALESVDGVLRVRIVK